MSEDATDNALLAATAEGNREAFRLLVHRYQGTVTRFATRLLNGDKSTAEDIGQEAFLRLYRRAGEYTDQNGLRAYLLTITRNLCCDHIRRSRPTETMEAVPETAGDEPSGENSVLQREQSEAVRLAIASLPEEQRSVLILSHYEGLSYQEIAQIVGCPPGTVASRRHHAIAFLRRRLRVYHEAT